jgi:hypothetical protein
MKKLILSITAFTLLVAPCLAQYKFRAVNYLGAFEYPDLRG